MINCGLLLLEYDDSVYIDALVVETPEEDDPIDIPIIPPPPPIIPPGILGNFFFDVSQTSTSGSGANAKFIVRANASTSAYEDVYVMPFNTGVNYANGDTITVAGNTLRGQTPTHDLTFQVAGVVGGKLSTLPGSTQNITGNANIYGSSITGNGFGAYIDRNAIGIYGAGGQVDVAPAANVDLTSNTAVLRNIAPSVPIDLANIENGAYTVLTNATPLGEMPNAGVADYGLRFEIDVEYANNQTVNNFVSNGQNFLNFSEVPTVINSQGEFEVTDDMVSAEIRLQGFNTLANVGGNASTVGFQNLKYDMFKVNKGDLGSFGL